MCIRDRWRRVRCTRRTTGTNDVACSQRNGATPTTIGRRDTTSSVAPDGVTCALKSADGNVTSRRSRRRSPPSHRIQPEDSIMRPVIRTRFGRRAVPREVEDELAFHLEMRARQLMESGLTHEAAIEEARRRFGDVGEVRDTCVTYDEKRLRSMNRLSIVHD